MLKALIFDVDGTLADTESAHRAAFNHAFAEEGLDWVWDEALYIELLEISGGKERIAHYWKQTRGDIVGIEADSLRDTIARLHELKTAAYEGMVNDGMVSLRPGVLRLIESAHEQGLALAIATTTSPVNIAALLRKAIGAHWRSLFGVVEDASTAPRKKPHPQVYLQTLQRMGMAGNDCLAIEDSANGLQAALAAGLPTVITPNGFTAHHRFEGALRVVPDLGDTTVADLRIWHSQSRAA
jgi:HAD superfamily hydrolase (TIGR01509 family)